MSFNPRAVDYVKRGFEKGFSESHISSVMKTHGYTSADIREAVSQARIKMFKPDRNTGKPYFGMILAGFAIAFIITILLISGKQEKIPTGAVVITDVDEYKAYLERITQLQRQVDEKQSVIDNALSKAQKAELNSQEKEELILEVQEYYEEVKREREETNKALLELMKFLFDNRKK